MKYHTQYFSIRRRLLLLLLVSLTLVWLAMLGFSYDKAHEEIHELADARLQQAAQTLLLLDLKRLGRLAKMQQQEQRDLKHDTKDRRTGNDDEGVPLAFQVWSSNGELLLHSPDAPSAPFLAQEGYATITIVHQPWRSYTVRDRKHDYQVSVMEPLATRDHLIGKLAQRMGRVLLLALPLLALLIWISISLSLRPLARLSDAIARQDVHKLEPIQLQQVPVEAQALITTLNHLLQRLANSLDKERAFTADAAHELRTPLAAIKIQAEVALAAQDDASRSHAIQQVISGVNRTTHLAQQLLMLARLEQFEASAQQAVDLGQLAADCMAWYADQASRKNIEFELVSDASCVLLGDPAMLRVMLDNLLDNAIKYGRANGHVNVTLQRATGTLLLEVLDDGEGVSATDHCRLQHRFFRVEGSAATGSGLGLSIVEKIVAAHGGKLEIGSGIKQSGLGVRIRFTL